jgi:hypothetical protein
MEGSVEWPGMETVSNDFAYSGNYSSKIDSISPYSTGFVKNMADGIYDSQTNVTISAWIMRESPTDLGDLVIVESTSDSTFFYKTFSLPAFTQKRKWEKINISANLPARTKSNEYLRIFFARYKGVLYIDDISVEVK